MNDCTVVYSKALLITSHHHYQQQQDGSASLDRISTAVILSSLIKSMPRYSLPFVFISHGYYLGFATGNRVHFSDKLHGSGFTMSLCGRHYSLWSVCCRKTYMFTCFLHIGLFSDRKNCQRVNHKNNWCVYLHCGGDECEELTPCNKSR